MLISLVISNIWYVKSVIAVKYRLIMQNKDIVILIANKLYRSDKVSNLFVKRTVKHNLRNYREILNDKAKPNYVDNSASFRLREIWNKLPFDIRNIHRLNIFKSSIGEMVDLELMSV